VLYEYEKKEVNNLESNESIYFIGNINKRESLSEIESQSSPTFDDDDVYFIFTIGDHVKYRYEVTKFLGKGSFAQVVNVIDHKSG
jgi:hypothetical protein